MNKNFADTDLATSDGPLDGRAETLRRDFGATFLAALTDPTTVGILLNSDGALWQERASAEERWRQAGTMTADRAALVARTAAACLPPKFAFKETRLGGRAMPAAMAIPTTPPTAASHSPLACVCCKPKPLQAAPTPLFRLCWSRVAMIRKFLRDAEREELRACHD
jgi:hypothetical protein